MPFYLCVGVIQRPILSPADGDGYYDELLIEDLVHHSKSALGDTPKTRELPSQWPPLFLRFLGEVFQQAGKLFSLTCVLTHQLLQLLLSNRMNTNSPRPLLFAHSTLVF